MYNIFKKSIKESGFSGWSYQIDELVNCNRLYLSKFDIRLKRNNDEYKIYFKIENGEIYITDAFVLKNFEQKKELSVINEHFKEAVHILNIFAERKSLRYVQKSGNAYR